MFDWIGDLIDAVVGAIQDGFEWIGETITSTIWTTMLRWFYETIYNAVADFLKIQGVASNRIVANGFGSRNPIASNDTAAGRQQNRRVEIVLISMQ